MPRQPSACRPGYPAATKRRLLRCVVRRHSYPAASYSGMLRDSLMPWIRFVGASILQVVASVGLDNFGAATAMGVSGVDRYLRLRIVVIFGVFEAAMPLVGLLLGDSVAHDLGGKAKDLCSALRVSTPR